MERAYNERDKTESGSYAQEYLNFFLEDEPSPGIVYEYRLVQQLLPTVTTGEASTFVRTLLGDDSRVLLATSPQKPGVSVPTEPDLLAALTAADQVAVTPWNETTVTRDLVETKPAPAAISSRQEVPGVGVTIVRFANGVEAWLKPTDFKNDQVLFDMEAPAELPGALLRLPEATLATSLVGLSGVGGLKALDLQKMLAGKLASASPYVGLSEHGISGGAPPAQLETALQLLYLNFTAPNDDAEAFALLTRQLAAAVANRGESPQQIFSDRLSLVNTSNHCTSTPLTPERVKALDRTKMTTFYRQRFANAADFTFFMAGAFKVDDALPLLARYVGSLPSTGKQTSRVVDLGIHFPDKNQVVRVDKGREPRAQTVISFFADPPPAPLEQEYVIAATTILDIALRDALREELGQTYTVGVGLSQPLPQRGADASGSVRSCARKRQVDDRPRRRRNQAAAKGWTVGRSHQPREGIGTTDLRDILRENGYWLRRMGAIRMFGEELTDIITRSQRIDSITPQILQDVFKRLSGRSVYGGHADAGELSRLWALGFGGLYLAKALKPCANRCASALRYRHAASATTKWYVGFPICPTIAIACFPRPPRSFPFPGVSTFATAALRCTTRELWAAARRMQSPPPSNSIR
jgi:zinc protease